MLPIKVEYEKIVKEMVCLKCGQKLYLFLLKKDNGLILCKKCKTVYLLDKGIFIILPETHASKEKYEKFLTKQSKYLQKIPSLKLSLEKYIKRLPKKINHWEDDDVKFWDIKYQQDCLELKSKKLVGRAYLRDKILFAPLRKEDLTDQKILEVGCGEAISAQKLLLPYGNDFAYYATDYAYEALYALKQRLNKRKNIVYLQVLGDALPFPDASFDNIICLGVMHHMPKKHNHVFDLVKKLRPGGLFLSNEPYDREYRLSPFAEKIIQKIIEPKQSAHEERIDIKKFHRACEKSGVIISEYHGHTPVKTVLIWMTGRLYERSIIFVRFVLLIDKITQSTLGKIWGLFSTGDCLLLLRKK